MRKLLPHQTLSLRDCHSKLGFEIFFRIAGSVYGSVFQYSLKNSWYPFPRCSLVPISTHISTTCVEKIEGCNGKFSSVCHRWFMKPPSIDGFLLFWAFNCDPSFILYKIIHKFLRNGVVDEYQPHFFHTVKLLANTTNTIMPQAKI